MNVIAFVLQNNNVCEVLINCYKSLLAAFLFKESFITSAVPFLVFLSGITLLVLIIGLST